MTTTRANLAMLLLAAVMTACVPTQPTSRANFKKAAPEKMAQTNMQLAIEYMKLGKLGDSRDFIERAQSEDPSNADVQMTSGIIYERLRENAKAERAYSTAYKIGKRDPNIVNAYAGFLCRNGKAQQGETLFLETAQSPVYLTPEVAWVNAGVCVRGTGDVLDAEKYFNRALAIRPNLPEAMLQLGNIAFDRGDAALALDWVKRYLAVNPATPEVLWLGVRAQRKLGDATGAAGYARRVQDEFPNSEQALMLRSGVDR
jgi:type IV pilus assembly protein PilF